MILRRIFAACAVFCALASPAFAQKTKAQLTTEIQSNFADNTTGAITPSNLRSVTTDTINSIMPTAPVGNGNLACFSGTTGLLQDCGVSPSNIPISSSQLPAPFTNGTATGNTNKFATSTGSLTTGDCVQLDSNGNFVDAGTTCVAANSWVTPEQFGAVGNGSTDDAAAFISLCSAISSGTVHWVRMTAGKTYRVWSSTPSTQSVLCNIGAVQGLRWDFNGAQFNVAYTGNAITYVFLMSGAQHVEINDMTGTAATGKHVSGDITGVNWVESACIGACSAGYGVQGLSVNRANVNGGMVGVAAVRSFGSGSYSTNIYVSGTFTNVGYGVANEADGLNTKFDIITQNAGRSYIGYNVSNVTGKIYSTNGTAGLEDVYITVYGYVGGGSGDISLGTTTGISIDYTNLASTTYGAGFFGLAHQQGDPVNANLATNISNIHLNMSILLNSAPSTVLLTSISTTGNSNTQAPGDPGNIENNIILEGRVQGTLTGSTLGYYMSTAEASSGWNGSSKGTFILQNFQAPSITQSLNIGTGATPEFRNVNIPNSNKPAFDSGSNANFQTYRNSIFGGAGQFPTNSYAFAQTCAIGVNFNSANTDTALAVPSPTQNYRLLSVYVTNASASISTATVGVFSGAGGTGTTLVTNVATGVTSGSANTSGNLSFLTVLNGGTASYNFVQVFVRVGTAQGSAATGDVCLQFEPLL